MMRATGLCVFLLASACASAPEAPPSASPVVSMTPGLPVPPQAYLYADCIAQAAGTMTLHRERDGGTLRFTCTGDVAKRFFDGMGQRAAEVGSEYVSEGRTWRFSNKLKVDAYGVDNCSTGAPGEYRCHVILSVGPFIEQMDYLLPPQ